MSRRPRDLGARWPGISILKPLKGCDGGLRENLLSFFHLDYPQYEILFSVANPGDPAVPVVHELLAGHPNAKARLIIGDVEATPNPKVNNLLRSYQEAQHDWLLVSDSNTRVAPDYLRRMAGSFHEDVGVVTAVVAGRGAQSLGGHLEACYLNTFYARCLHFADFFSIAFVLGKSMLFRRSVADRFGGLRHLGNYVAEDYLMGEAMRRLGLKVAVNIDPVPQFIGKYRFGAFWQRHLRWGRIRRSQVPFLFAIEPFQSMIVSGLSGAYAAWSLFEVAPVNFFAGHALLWAAADNLLQSRLVGKLTWKMVASWLLRELLAFPLWLHMAAGSHIEWRGAKMRVLGGGMLQANPPNIFAETRYPTAGLASE